MSLRSIMSNPALKDNKELELNEEWNNFVKRIGEVSGLVKDMASGDKARADAALSLADKYLNGKVIIDEDVEMKVKSDRTVINKKAFKSMENEKGEIDKDAWMAEMSKDAEMRYHDRKVRRERADTLKTQAKKAFDRGEFEKALSCYNRALEQVKDNPMLYCDRALTNIKLGNFAKLKPLHHGQRMQKISVYEKRQTDGKYPTNGSRSPPAHDTSYIPRSACLGSGFNEGAPFLESKKCMKVLTVNSKNEFYGFSLYENDTKVTIIAVFQDCDWAIRLNENSFKARLYKAKAHKELEETNRLEECLVELREKFPQHEDLIHYFLAKNEGKQGEEEEDGEDE